MIGGDYFSPDNLKNELTEKAIVGFLKDNN